METPTSPGEYEFKGMLVGVNEWATDVDFFDWSPAKVFLNTKTKRLNATVTNKEGDPFSDFIRYFKGEWRAKQ